MLMMLATRPKSACPITRSKCYACWASKAGRSEGQSYKPNPADAHDARHAGSLNHSVEVLRLLGF